MTPLQYIWDGISRSKTLDVHKIHDTQLKRCLNVVDLIGLGVGSSLGIGVYVIISHVARNQAGPSVVISVLVAGVAALLAGLCYAEFSARVPRAGSAYLYGYVTVGELCAFVVGWTMVLENMIGAAAASKAWTQYLDNMLNNTIHKYLEKQFGWTAGPGMENHPDIMAFSALVVATGIVMIGVKVTSSASFVFTLLNIVVVACIICVGFFHVSSYNWTNPPGFFPFGCTGVLSGAATMFFAFIGFDTIANTGEEAKEPSRTIPLAIIITLSLNFMLYFGVAMALTLAFPWYHLSDRAALPRAYEARKIFGSDYVIGFGGLCGLTAAMLSMLYPLPRILYSMASDHLLVKCLCFVSSVTRTPLSSTMIGGILSAVIALLFRLDALIDSMAIGTLAAYTVVSLSVLCLRYEITAVGLHKEYEDILDLRHSQESTDFINTGFQTLKENVLRIDRVEPFYSSTETLSKSSHSQSYLNQLGSQCIERKESYVSQKSKSVICTEVQDVTPILGGTMSRGSTYQRISSMIAGSSLGSLFQLPSDSAEPSEKSWKVFSYSLVCFILSSVSLCALTVHGQTYITCKHWWALLLLSLVIALVIGSVVFIARQPKNKTKLLFTTPYLPVVPLTSFIMNAYLMTSLPLAAWIRFAIWLAVGLILYFGYGIHKSRERENDDQEVILYEIAASGYSSPQTTSTY